MILRRIFDLWKMFNTLSIYETSEVGKKYPALETRILIHVDTSIKIRPKNSISSNIWIMFLFGAETKTLDHYLEAGERIFLSRPMRKICL